MNTREEVKRCRDDFLYFSSKYLKIVTKDSRLGNLHLNTAQKSIIKGFSSNNHVMLLKARQLGSTTGIAAYFFWKALFRPYTTVAVVAHTDQAVKKIFEIYRLYYSELPDFLKLETSKSRENEIKFITGSSIRVGSASSQSFRGGTYNLIHASEYAFWNNMDETIASLFSTATESAQIILESTANGMNDAYEMWTRDNGFTKIFLGWKADAEYALDEPYFDDPTEEEVEYSYENKLNEKQFNWMVKTLRTKCANNWNIYNQEFPAQATDAFITSGSPFFPVSYQVLDTKDGYEEYDDPKKFGIYIMGVDTATGSPGGDYSAFMVLDATVRDSIKMVASFYERMPPSLFAKRVLKTCNKYNPLLVIETNSYGLSILEGVQSAGYPHLYRNTSFDKVTNSWRNQLGFSTNVKTRPLLFSRLYEYVTRGWLEIKCPRFMSEANRLRYNSRGKVEASPGQHDDMIMATGFALMGLDQVADIEEEVKRSFKPSNLREVLEWECATGRKWNDAKDSEFAKDSGNQLFGLVDSLL